VISLGVFRETAICLKGEFRSDGGNASGVLVVASARLHGGVDLKRDVAEKAAELGRLGREER
jgi:hypothetical protein